MQSFRHAPSEQKDALATDKAAATPNNQPISKPFMKPSERTPEAKDKPPIRIHSTSTVMLMFRDQPPMNLSDVDYRESFLSLNRPSNENIKTTQPPLTMTELRLAVLNCQQKKKSDTQKSLKVKINNDTHTGVSTDIALTPKPK
jgi:hypothetical protein